MDTALTQKVPFILDRNLAKAYCTGNHVCTSCDRVVLGSTAKNGFQIRIVQQEIHNIKKFFFYMTLKKNNTIIFKLIF